MTRDDPATLSRHPRGRGSRSAAEAGFTLVEIGVVLALLGIILTMGAEFVGSYRQEQHQEEVRREMDVIESMIVNFVAQNRRLPCPANGTQTTGATVGRESRTGTFQCTGDQANGVVPWVTLGISADAATDPWGNLYTLRVAANSVRHDGGSCDSSTTGTVLVATAGRADGEANDGMFLGAVCEAGTIGQGLRGMGLEVVDAYDSNTALMDPTPSGNTAIPTGAAYVLISHGPNRLGALTIAGQSTEATTSGTAEHNNRAGATAHASGSGTYSAGPPGADFDDTVRYMSIFQLASRAKLGPGPNRTGS